MKKLRTFRKGKPMRTSLAIAIFYMCLTIPVFSQGTFHHMKVSEDIDVVQLSTNAYVHVSYAEFPGFGRIGSNGFIYTNNGEALLFDTPVNDSLTEQLVTWIKDSLKMHLVGFVPNHWHNDCMGGLNYLHSIGITSYANEKTIAIAQSKNLPVPQNGFVDSLVLHLGNQTVICKYYGPAHTADNIVTWIPSERILFGGCMVKELKSNSLGNIADADLTEWPKTIERIIVDFSSAVIVIPGHGEFGGQELLQHTLELLRKTK
jgi:metallo-beta-lactamase class B